MANIEYLIINQFPANDPGAGNGSLRPKTFACPKALIERSFQVQKRLLGGHTSAAEANSTPLGLRRQDARRDLCYAGKRGEIGGVIEPRIHLSQTAILSRQAGPPHSLRNTADVLGDLTNSNKKGPQHTVPSSLQTTAE